MVDLGVLLITLLLVVVVAAAAIIRLRKRIAMWLSPWF
jgi:hypothetical protein